MPDTKKDQGSNGSQGNSGRGANEGGPSRTEQRWGTKK